MKEFSTEQIQKAFEKLPKELQAAISSPDIHEKIMAIGQNHGLHIDQVGELVDQIGLVMLGLEKASNFVDATSSRLSISSKEAQGIADDVNTNIFSAIKTSMRQMEERAQTNGENKTDNTRADLSALERAGGFSVEPSMASSSADGHPAGESMTDESVTEHDKSDILSGIEDPKPATSRMEENDYEPLVDHLLGTSNTQTEQKTVHKAPEPPMNLPSVEETPAELSMQNIPVPQKTVPPPTSKPISAPVPKPAPQPTRPKGPDPYREPVE